MVILKASMVSSSACRTCGCDEKSCAPCHAPVVCSNCVSCCCDSAHASWRHGRISAGIRVEFVSMAWMVVEASGSIVFGLAAGSLALLAFGGDSLIELISGLAVLVHLRRDAAGSRANDGTATGRITSTLLFALIPVIGLSAGYSYFTGVRPVGSPAGMAVAIGAITIMPFLWLEKSRIGRETRSLPLSVDAIESVTCFFMSVAALGGLIAEYLGFWWVDYVAAGVILAFVMKEAVESYREVEKGERPETGITAASGTRS